MLLTYGDVKSIDKTLPWYTVELRSEKTMESTIKRMGSRLAEYFKDSPVEIFIPIAQRDLNVFELRTGNLIFARSPNFEALLKLRKITGIIGLITEGDSNRPVHALKIDDIFIQEQIREVETNFTNRAVGIEPGAFVRILDGDMRDLCGTVVSIENGTACVKIQLKTKELFNETPTRNLLNISDVPENLRVFYYSPMVQSLADNEEGFMIREDLTFTELPVAGDDGLSVKKVRQVGRQQTITARIRRLIFTQITDPLKIAEEVVRALEQGELKKPKTISILHGVIKERLIEDFFALTDPTIKNYRDVIHKFGNQWKFSIQDIAKLAPDLGIPLKAALNDESNEVD